MSGQAFDKGKLAKSITQLFTESPEILISAFGKKRDVEELTALESTIYGHYENIILGAVHENPAALHCFHYFTKAIDKFNEKVELMKQQKDAATVQADAKPASTYTTFLDTDGLDTEDFKASERNKVYAHKIFN